MKKPLARLIPLLARGLAPTAAVASGLLSPVAIGASGDLDPTFADVGRLADFDYGGPAWSLELLDEDVIVAGGEECLGWDCGYYYDYAYNFVDRVTATGSLDPGFDGARLENVEVLDVAVQSDGKAIAVGRTIEDHRGRSALTVFRLEREGPLDPTFGDAGIFRSTSGRLNTANAVALDPDGRILVAGLQDTRLIVTRLLRDGAVDDSFGSSGTFLGPVSDAGGRMHILRTGGGGYRITWNAANRCSVIALTASGAQDASFGSGGIALIDGPQGTTARCNSMAAQSDGKLLLAGQADERGFARRLLTNGEADSSFATENVADVMQNATALAVGADDSVLVAGRGPVGVSGALVVRLQADGELDVLFGNAGSTWIDLPSYGDSAPEIHDMTVLPDGRVVAAGGHYYGAYPFVVRLLGEQAADAPGVVGVKLANLAIEEASQQAVVTVRRTGGDTGSISVDYQTVVNDWELATAGVDFTHVTGRLTWDDGDAGERQIIVPIAMNDADPEPSEWFTVALSDVQGGAGLGTRNATIEIIGNAPPQPPVPQPPASSSPRGGGGALGFFSLLLLGVGRLLQRARCIDRRA